MTKNDEKSEYMDLGSLNNRNGDVRLHVPSLDVMPSRKKGLKASLALNFVLIGALLSWAMFTPKTTIVTEPYQAVFCTNESESSGQSAIFSSFRDSKDISTYFAFSDEELLEIVFQPPKPLFSGFTSQDLALSFLYSRGMTVDIPLKACGVWPQGMETIPFQDANGEWKTVACFTGLQNEHLHAIQSYLRQEKTPYTAQKLYNLLKKENAACFKEAFYRTQEWFDLKQLLGPFFKTDEKMWTYLSMFSWDGVLDHITISQALQNEALKRPHQPVLKKDMREALVQVLVRDFMRTHSQELARCLVMSSPHSILVKAPKEVLHALFQAIPEDASDSGVVFALQVIKAPTKDDIFQAARAYISSRYSIPNVNSMGRKELLAYLAAEKKGKTPTALSQAEKKNGLKDQPEEKKKLFSSSLEESTKTLLSSSQKKGEVESKSATSVSSPTPSRLQENKSDGRQRKESPATTQEIAMSSGNGDMRRAISQEAARDKISPFIYYTVRKGDTLWSISKKFQVSVDKVRYLNRIKGNNLPPGLVLKIPKTG